MVTCTQLPCSIQGPRSASGNYFFFFSLFNFRLSLGSCGLFFCFSLLPLSLFPLSPISDSPCLKMICIFQPVSTCVPVAHQVWWEKHFRLGTKSTFLNDGPFSHCLQDNIFTRKSKLLLPLGENPNCSRPSFSFLEPGRGPLQTRCRQRASPGSGLLSEFFRTELPSGPSRSIRCADLWS